MKIHIIFQGQLATFSPTDPFLNILSNIKVSFQNPLPTNFVLFDPETQKIFNEASYNGLATSTKQEINLFIKDISDIPESEAEETPKESHNDETSYIIKLEPVLVAIQEAWKQKKLKINEDLDKLITVQVQCTIGDHLRQMREKVKKLSTKFIPKLPDRIEEEKIALNESPERVIEKPVPVIEKPVEKKIEKIVDEIIEKEILTPVSPNTNPITNTKSPKTDIDLKKRTTSQCWSFREEIIDLFRRDQLFIVEGPKGIGKSTQIPEFVLDELKGGQSDKKITVVQQYEILAKVGAERVSKDAVKEFEYSDFKGRGVGEVVGYSLMFEEERSDLTRITYTTYEKLFREASQDPGLNK